MTCERSSRGPLSSTRLTWGPEAARASDQAILDRVDDINALLLRGLMMALAEDDADWFSRYAWFVDLVTAMLEDAAGKPPDE